MPRDTLAGPNPGVTPPELHFHPNVKAAQSCVINLANGDNEVCITANDRILYYDHFLPKGGNLFNKDIINDLVSGVNIVVITLDNHGYPETSPNPSNISGNLIADSKSYAIEYTQDDIRQGICYQAVFVIYK